MLPARFDSPSATAAAPPGQQRDRNPYGDAKQQASARVERRIDIVQIGVLGVRGAGHTCHYHHKAQEKSHYQAQLIHGRGARGCYNRRAFLAAEKTNVSGTWEVGEARSKLVSGSYCDPRCRSLPGCIGSGDRVPSIGRAQRNTYRGTHRDRYTHRSASAHFDAHPQTHRNATPAENHRT